MRASLARASPFKSSKPLATMHSPEMSEDEDRSFEDDVVAPLKFIEESDEERGGVDEDEEETGGGSGESLAICPGRPAMTLANCRT
jgi:hypothetical protein